MQEQQKSAGLSMGDRGGAHLVGEWVLQYPVSDNYQRLTLDGRWWTWGIGRQRKPGAVAGLKDKS